MRRFDEDGLFDRLAGSGRLTPALAGALGEEVARFHARVPASPGHGSVGHVAHVIALDHAMQRRHLDVFPAAAVDALYTASTASLARLAPQLEARRLAALADLAFAEAALAEPPSPALARLLACFGEPA